jgi:hypothetical protein
MSTVGKDEAKAILRRFQVWQGRQYSYRIRLRIEENGKVSAVWDHPDYLRTVEEPSLRVVEDLLQGFAHQGGEQ